jgi:tellurite resistance protein TerC
MFVQEGVAFLAFNLVIGALLVGDLLLFRQRPRAMAVREALLWSGFWISLALAFNLFLPWGYKQQLGGLGVGELASLQPGREFFLCYVIELSLSVDNLFVFLAIFGYFGVHGRHQHRILFWGIVAAVVLRGLMIVGGVALITRFHGLIYVLGAFLIATGVKLALQGDEPPDPSKNLVVRWARRWLPIAEGDFGEKFLVRIGGHWMATKMLLVLLVVEMTDVVFALDSIPAALAVSRDPFIVYSANFLAILGLRSLYFAVAGLMGAFEYLKYGLAAVLTFIGVKMVTESVFPISTTTSLIVVASCLSLSIIVSILHPNLPQRSSDQSSDQ